MGIFACEKCINKKDETQNTGQDGQKKEKKLKIFNFQFSKFSGINISMSKYHFFNFLVIFSKNWSLI